MTGYFPRTLGPIDTVYLDVVAVAVVDDVHFVDDDDDAAAAEAVVSVVVDFEVHFADAVLLVAVDAIFVPKLSKATFLINKFGNYFRNQK